MPSYSQYKRQIAVLDADDIQWITVKGNHIPIKEGQSKEDAVKSFLKSKGGNSSAKGSLQKNELSIAYHKDKGHIKEGNPPKGWSKVEGATTAPNGYSWYSNNKSMFGGERESYLYKDAEKKPESSKKWSGAWKPTAEQKQEAGFRLLEIGYNDVDFGKDPAKNKQSVLEAIKESGTENADYLTNIVKNMPDNSFSDVEKFRTGVKNAKKDLSSPKKESSGWIESPKFDKLTKQYMPATGEADNELGETLRSINRVVYRYYNDGDMWNKGYGKETVNWAVKHLAEVAKNKNTPKHIARGIENGLYEMKTYGVKDKDRYETALKILVQTMEFADKTDIESLSKIKRNTKKATDSWHKLWGKK